MRNRGVFVALAMLAVAGGFSAVRADATQAPDPALVDPSPHPRVFFPPSAATAGSAVVSAPIGGALPKADSGCDSLDPCAVPSPALNTLIPVPPTGTLSRLARPGRRHRG